MTIPSLAIIGSGRAGTAAAAVAAQAGIAVHLFDRFAIDIDDLVPGTTVYASTPVWGLFPSWQVAASQGDEPVLVRVDAVLLANGSIDRTVTFAGSTKPGVINASALAQLIDRWRILPGNQFVILGDGDAAAESAARITQAGGEVISMVAEDTSLALEVVGDTAMTGLNIAGSLVAADTLVIAVGALPDLTLAAMAGCDMFFDDSRHTWQLTTDGDGRTSVPGIWAAGSVAGASEDAALPGQRAAEAIVASLTDTYSSSEGPSSDARQNFRQPWHFDERIGTGIAR